MLLICFVAHQTETEEAKRENVIGGILYRALELKAKIAAQTLGIASIRVD